jgi:hypothetical protein
MDGWAAVSGVSGAQGAGGDDVERGAEVTPAGPPKGNPHHTHGKLPKKKSKPSFFFSNPLGYHAQVPRRATTGGSGGSAASGRPHLGNCCGLDDGGLDSYTLNTITQLPTLNP